ncbi:hypothetical protein ACHJH3_09305 [Campylobacter sp. MOP7]|uniref:hypothetical protein n=1 Tax=Campylobacter canis TaxID=3378588 RepID=UPI00387E3B45
MFEGNLSYSDLEDIKNELKDVAKIKFDQPKKYLAESNEILENIVNINSSESQKIKLQSLQKRYKSTEDTKKILEYLDEDICSRDFELLPEASKDMILKFETILEKLEELNFNTSPKSLKIKTENFKKLEELLVSQEELVEDYLASISKDERVELYREFLKNESEIYKIYNKTSSVLSTKLSNFKELSIVRIKNSMKNDLFYWFKLITKNITISFWILVFIGSAICSFYFFSIKKVPQINLDELMPLIIFASFAALFWLSCIVLSSMFSCYFLYKTNYKKQWIFVISQFYLLFLLALPFLSNYISEEDTFGFVLSYYEQFLIFYLVFISVYFVLNIIKYSKSKLDDTFLLSVFLAPELLFIIFVLDIFIHDKYDGLGMLLLIYILLFFVIARLLSLSKNFEYKPVLFITLLISFISTYFISPNLVSIINLANYKENFTIKKEFIPKEILNLPLCFEGYHLACINENLSDDKKIKIDNLVVEVKSEDRYYFKAEIKDGFKFPISKKQYFENLLKDSCDENSSIQLLDHNDTHIAIKNYKSLFCKPNLKNNGEFIRKFNIHKKNIEN